MNAQEFLVLARELAVVDGAAHRRTAISRSYYAAYHSAIRFLRACGVEVSTQHDAHSFVQEALITGCTVSAVITSGVALRWLQNRRIKADYWLLDPDPERAQIVETSLTRAAQIVTSLSAVAAEAHILSRVTGELQQWAAKQ